MYAKQDVIDVYVKMHVAADECKWDDWKKAFLEEVDVDMSSITGKPVERFKRDAWLESYWKAMTPKFQPIMKFMDNHVVEINGDKATARCYVRVLHVIPGAPGGESLISHGIYTFGLVLVGKEWKIASTKTELMYDAGNKGLRAIAAKMSAKP